jgi:hypothetical protein
VPGIVALLSGKHNDILCVAACKENAANVKTFANSLAAAHVLDIKEVRR